MNKFYKVFLIATMPLSIISCGSGEKKAESKDQSKDENKTMSGADSKSNIGNKAKTSSNSNEEKMKERRAKGDTLAMPYTELQKYLPSSVDGYKAEKPNGATINMMKMSYSSADIKFKKDNGDWVKVTIVDYNQAYNLYTAATAMWTMGMSIDTPEEKMNSINFDNTVGGWEVYKKNRKDATVTLGVGSRFWVNIEANNQNDTEMIKSIAKTMDLSKLSTL